MNTLVQNLKRVPFVKIAITLCLFWFVFSKTDMRLCWEFMHHVPLFTILGVIFFFWTLQALIAKRWGAVLETQGYSFAFYDLFRAVFIGHLFSQGLPSSIGGDVYRVMILKDAISLDKSLSSILFERLLGFFCFGLMVIFVTLVDWSQIRDSVLLWPTITALALFFSVFSFVTIVAKMPERWLEKIPFIDRLMPFVELKKAVFKGPQHFIKTFFYSFMVSINTIWVTIFLAYGMGLDLSLWAGITVFPLVFIIASLPFSIGGWGLREGIVVVTLSAYNIPPEQAVAFSILYGFLQLVSAFPGLFFFLKHTQKPQNNHVNKDA